MTSETNGRYQYGAVVVATLASVIALVAVVVAVRSSFSEGPFVPITVINPAGIVDAEGTIPTVEGIEGPAIAYTFEQCGDESCAVVPYSFTQENTTDTAVAVAIFGGWEWVNDAGDHRFCETAAGESQFTIPPGDSVIAVAVNFPDCVFQDLKDFAADGVLESEGWSITGRYDPVGGGENVEIRSLRFTLVHPDSPFAP